MTSKRSPHRSSTPPEAIAMLIEDHRKVETLFKRYAKGGEAEKVAICELACKMLKAHTRLEEELLYPAAAEALDDESPVTEAQIEHRLAKRLIEDLESGESRDAGFKVLSEVVMHHVDEEESDFFPKLRKSDIDFEALGTQMKARKLAIEGELSIAPDSVVLPSPSRTPRRTTRSGRGGRTSQRSGSRRHAA